MNAIAIVGGGGALGYGLALRWAEAGRDVIIGSRRLESAQEAAEKATAFLACRGVKARVRGMTNPEAAAEADIVALTVPFAQQDQALDAIRRGLAGKILIDTSVPLVPPKVGTVQLPPEGCSALRVQQRVGNDVRVVSAFQNVAAVKLASLEPLDCDVLITGDDKEARQAVIALTEAAGMRGYHAGPLANAVAAEALTSVLITVNRQLKCHASIRLVGTGGDVR